MTKHIRVLAINGGGVRGIIPATILKYISEKTGQQIPELFDFIIGTSIGGILATAYATPNTINSVARSDVRFNASQVLDIIKDNAKSIFPPDKVNSGFDLVTKAKYSRQSLDDLLQQKFNVNGIDLKLMDTLVPIALTSQNAISNEPQIWFSCSKKFSTYYLKDVTGATSAAPFYLPPKFISVQNQTEAEAQNCTDFNLVKSNGTCQYKTLDGGLFGNAPALLTSYLLNQVTLNKTTNECTNKYNIFGGLLPSQLVNLTIQLASTNPNSAPRIHLSDDLDITVVSLGTGYFTEEEISQEATNELISSIEAKVPKTAVIALTAFASAITLFGTIYTIFKIHNMITAEKKDICSKIPDLLLGVTSTLFGVAVIIAGSKAIQAIDPLLEVLERSKDSEDGAIGLIKNNIISSTLASNEAADLVISRDVFGTIAVNPAFSQTAQIPLDATDDASLNLLEQTTINFINNNLVAFNNLTICLQNSVNRTVECDYTSMYFYDYFRDLVTQSIDSRVIEEVEL